MDSSLSASICLICFELTEKHMYVPADAPAKIFSSCNKYLHSTLTQENLKNVQLSDKNQLPLCKSCFDSALELTQLCQQLTTIEKVISDLTIAFSMAVFDRRNQVLFTKTKTNIVNNHGNSKMESSLEASVCLICFELIESPMHVSANVPAKILNSCNKYLHSTLTQENLKDVQLSDKNQLPLCKTCFDSALELTQLCQQLTTIEKDISDLTVAFSMTVFHRRSQVYKLSQLQSSSSSFQTSSIIEFNEACLPPNLFSTKTADQIINNYNNNQEIVINSLNIKTDIADVKFESFDVLFGNISGNSQPFIAKEDEEIQFNRDNLDADCVQSIIEHNNSNILPVSKITDVPVPGANDSKTCTNRKNGIQLSMSDLLKCVQMPAIKLKRLKIGSSAVGASVVNSYKKKCESGKQIIDVTLNKTDHIISDHSYAACSSDVEKLLKCLYCERTFTHESHRSVHHRSHTGEKRFECTFCTQKFVSRSYRKIHEKLHTGSSQFKCSYCEKCFHSMSLLIVHERVHTGEKPYKCWFCDKKFAQLSTLQQHERIHTGKKPFQCSFCDKSFAGLSALKSHERRIHTGEKPFTCSFCKKGFATNSDLNNHRKTLTHMKKCTPESSSPFKCSYCEKCFPRRAILLVHERAHTGEKPYKCSFCEKKFVRLSNLQQHERIHTGEKPYKCSFCEKSFAAPSARRSHERRIHIGEKPFTCSFCKKGFCEKGELKIHEMIHSGEKPFQCSFCEKSFPTNSALQIHVRTHTGEKPFTCSFCQRCFKIQSILRNHERIHTGETPYKCLYCEKSFRQLQSKKLHQKNHHKTRSSLICTICNLKCDSLVNLKHHEKTHNSTTPIRFKCSFCKITFRKKEDRNIHEKTHSKENQSLNDNLIIGI